MRSWTFAQSSTPSCSTVNNCELIWIRMGNPLLKFFIGEERLADMKYIGVLWAAWRMIMTPYETRMKPRRQHIPRLWFKGSGAPWLPVEYIHNYIRYTFLANQQCHSWFCCKKLCFCGWAKSFLSDMQQLKHHLRTKTQNGSTVLHALRYFVRNTISAISGQIHD